MTPTNTAPQLGLNWSTGGGNDPDQTFGEYVRELLATSKGFGGPFTQPPGQQQPSPTPQTSITKGLFGDYLGTGGSGDGSSAGPSASSSSPFGSAPDAAVHGWGKAMDAMNTTQGKQAVATVLGTLFGPVGSIFGKAAPAIATAGYNNAMNNAMNALDATNNAFATAAAMPGIGTVSDAKGNVSTISNPAIEAAALNAMFGIGTDFGNFGMSPGASYGGSPGDGGVGDGIGGTSSSGHGGGDMGHGMDGW
jgi:hypothetical protein